MEVRTGEKLPVSTVVEPGIRTRGEYDSLEQIQRIARCAPLAETVSLAQCRHSPHRDQPDQVLEALALWTKHR